MIQHDDAPLKVFSPIWGLMLIPLLSCKWQSEVLINHSMLNGQWNLNCNFETHRVESVKNIPKLVACKTWHGKQRNKRSEGALMKNTEAPQNLRHSPWHGYRNSRSSLELDTVAPLSYAVPGRWGKTGYSNAWKWMGLVRGAGSYWEDTVSRSYSSQSQSTGSI